jgi:putative tRNA adenosine deaminase-associated protein
MPEGNVMVGDSTADFVVVAYQEDGQWQATSLPSRVAEDLDSLLAAMRAQPSDRGTVALVSVDEDFFVLVRLVGRHIRLLVSDSTAADDAPLARDVLDELDVPVPEDEDFDTVQPAGDLGLLTDLGMDAMALGALCDDLDLYPDEMLARIATRLGFGEHFQRAVDAALR